MSRDPVLAAIDDTLEAVRPSVCACGCGHPIGPASKSMYYAAESCQHRWMERGKRTTATGPGWVSPPNIRYQRVEEIPPCEVRCGHGLRCLGWTDSPGHWYLCDSCTSARPDEWQVHLLSEALSSPRSSAPSDDVASHRPATPLQIIWRALAKRRHP